MSRRPLLHLTLAHVAGVAAGHILRPPPIGPLVLGLVALGLAAYGDRGDRPRGVFASAAAARVRRGLGSLNRSGLAVLVAVFCAGAFLAGLAWQRLGPGPDVAGVPGRTGGLTASSPARWASLLGHVVSDPRPTETGYRFFLRARAAGRYWRKGEMLYVGVLDAAGDAAASAEAAGEAPGEAPGTDVPGEAPPVAAGDLVRVTGFLSRPRPPGNPGEFDFPRYLATRGARYSMTVQGGPLLEGRPRTGGLASLCRQARDGLLRAMDEALPPEQASLLGGLLFGDTSRLPEDTARDFRRSGVYHILAVSGSNVAFIAGGFWMVGRPLLRLTGMSGSAAERRLWPATAVVLVAYAVMSGLGASVTRATVMAEAGLVYLWLGRRRDVWGPICLAVLVMTARQPLIILDVGFQLSFAATLGILGLYPPLSRWAERSWLPGLLARLPGRFGGPVTVVARAALVSLAAQAAVSPVLITHFGEFSLAGLLANIVVVPLSGAAVTLGLAAAIAALLGPVGHLVAGPLFGVTSIILRATAGVAHLLAGVPFASVIVGSPPLWFSVVYYASGLWILRGTATGRAWRRLLLVLLMAATFLVGGLTAGAVAAAGGWEAAEVTFLDVGQGDAVFIRLPDGYTILVDGGPAGAGDRILCPYLRHQGIARVDTVIVSHIHDDHVGGLAELLADRGLAVGEVVLARGAGQSSPAAAFLEAAALRRIPVREVAAGDRLAAPDGRVWVEVLWPWAADPISRASPATDDETSARENDRSLVLRLQAGGVTILLPGDLESTGEKTLLAGRQPPLSQSDLGSLVLKVAHHGSAYATGPAFLSSVRPALAVVSVGRNVFGHPSPETLARLAASGAAILTTKTDGAVTLTLRGGRAGVTSFRSGRNLVLPASGASLPSGGASRPGAGGEGFSPVEQPAARAALYAGFTRDGTQSDQEWTPCACSSSKISENWPRRWPGPWEGRASPSIWPSVARTGSSRPGWPPTTLSFSTWAFRT